MYQVSQKNCAFDGVWKKVCDRCSKLKRLIYQSKANLDEKHFFAWESKIPRSILVHDLCGIEVYIVSFRNRILISLASKSWTRIKY